LVVLVTEDELLLRMLVANVLTTEGLIVLEAEHSDAALAICEARVESIHALSTDIQMPGSMNGLELAQHVSARWPWIAFLITSRRTPHGGVAVAKPVFIQTV
jgi:CheY-like chemotaxis protein